MDRSGGPTARPGADGLPAALRAALREVGDPHAVRRTAARVLREGLDVDRTVYATDDGSPAWLAAASPVLNDLLRGGRTVVVGDTATDGRIDAEERRRCRRARVAGIVAVPLLRDGTPEAVLAVQTARPRAWTVGEVARVVDAAEQVRAADERARTQLALRDSEARFGALFSAIDQGFCLCEMILGEDGTPRDYRFLDVNPRFEALTGLEGATGRTALELVPGLERRWIETYAEVAYGGRPARFQDGSEAMGRVFDVFATPVAPLGRFALVFTDITERTRSEAALRASAARDRLRALLTDTLRALSDPHEMQEQTARLLCRHMGVDRAFFAEWDGDAVVVRGGHAEAGPPVPDGPHRPDDLGAAVAEASRTGATTAVGDDPAPAALAARSHLTAWVTRKGRPAGLLAVHRTDPHAWTDDEADLVEEAAERVWTAVERARAEAALRAGEERFRTVVEVSPQFVWVVAPDGVMQFVNRRWTEYSGLDLARSADLEVLAASIHPDERREMFRRWRESLATGEEFEIEARLRSAEGAYRWFLVRTVPLTDADGRVLSWFGVSTDIHERHRAEEALRDEEERERRAHRRAVILAAVGQALDEEIGVDRRLDRLARCLVPDPADLCVVDVADGDGLRRAATARAGSPGAALTEDHERAIREVLAGGAPRLVASGAGTAVPQAAVVPIRVRGETFGVLTVGVTGFSGRRLDGGDLDLLAQIGDRAGLAVDNARLFEREERARLRADRLRRRVEDLQGLTAELSRATSRADVAEVGMRAALRATGSRRAWILEDAGDPDGLRTLDASGFPDDVVAATRIVPRDAALPLVEATLSGRPLFVGDREALAAGWPDFVALNPEVGAAAFVPVSEPGGRPAGLGLCFPGSRVFSEADRNQLVAIGRLVGQALARAERYEAERDVSRLLQRSLLPSSLPKVEGLAIATHYSPGTAGTEAGGDWYDAFPLRDGRLAVTVGDVVGRGPGAAAVMGQLRSALKAYLHEGRAPADALAQLNSLTEAVDDALASTAVCVVIDPATGEGAWARAGHPPPMHVRAGHAAILDELRGPLLGVSPDAFYEEGRLVLAPGESLVAFSDGLFERRGEGLDAGLDRLAAELGRHVPLAPALVAAAREMSRGSADDVVAVAVTRAPAALARSTPAVAGELSGHRTALRDWLAPLGLPRDTRDDMVLAVGEATSNVVDHAYAGRDAGPMHTTAEITHDGDIRITVRDAGLWRDPRPAGDVTRGRGLPIVRAVAAAADVQRTPAGTTVVMTFRAPGTPVGAGPAGDGPPPRRPAVVDGTDGRLTVTGDLDRDGAAALAGAAGRMLPGGADVSLDLRGVTYMDSESTAALVRLAAQADGSGTRLRVVVAPDGPVARLLALTGLGDRLSVLRGSG